MVLFSRTNLVKCEFIKKFLTHKCFIISLDGQFLSCLNAHLLKTFRSPSGKPGGTVAKVS